MKLKDFFKEIEDKHKPENIDEDERYPDYAGIHESFDEGTALQQFRDCFREDIE